MSYGLAGAQRTGKSTLARAFSERTGIPFLETSASKVFAEMGLDPKVDYPFDVRLAIQNRILDAFSRQYREATADTVFVSDRTPIDLMAYTLADVQRNTLSPELSAELLQYLRRCIELTNKHFSVLVLVQPGIQLVEERGKAPANEGHMEHINAIARGLIGDERISAENFTIPRGITNLTRRVDAVVRAIEIAQQRMDKTVSQYRSDGVLFH